MHHFAHKIMECVKSKVDEIGIDNVEGQHLEELEKWCCIADKIVEYDYYYHIVEAMKKAEEEGEEEAKEYYTRMRDSRGRYMRGYTPEIHNPNSEHMRDMDRYSKGMMYFTEPEHMSKYDSARKHYTDSKNANPNDEQGNIKAIENIANVLTDDLMEMKPKMSQAEKTMMKQKLANAMNQL